MKVLTTIFVIVLAIAVIPPLLYAHAPHDVREHHERIDPSTLPVIPVKIVNGTDASLSLTITNALCAPRIMLKPGEEAVIANCLRWGLVYHVVAVFYRGEQILERQSLLFVVKPNQPWMFFNLPQE